MWACNAVMALKLITGFLKLRGNCRGRMKIRRDGLLGQTFGWGILVRQVHDEQGCHSATQKLAPEAHERLGQSFYIARCYRRLAAIAIRPTDRDRAIRLAEFEASCLPGSHAGVRFEMMRMSARTNEALRC